MFFAAMPRKETALKTDLPMCFLPVLECLVGRMDETVFIVDRKKKLKI